MKALYTLTAISLVAGLTTATAQNSNRLNLSVIYNTNLVNQESSSQVLFFNSSGSDSLDFVDMTSMIQTTRDDSTIKPYSVSAEGIVINQFDNRPELTDYKSIQIGFASKRNATISVTAVTDSIHQIGYAWIEQVSTGMTYSILNDTATFSVTADSNWVSDYKLHTGPPTMKSANDASCFASTNGNINVSNPGCTNWRMDIYHNSVLYSSSNANTPNLTIAGLAAGTYTVVTHICNMLVDSGNVIISSPAPLVASFTADSYSTVIATPVSFSNFSSNVTTYSWDFGDGNTSNLTDPIHSYAAANNYIVSLLITDSTGCQQFVSDTIEVLNLLPLRYSQVGGRDSETGMGNPNPTERNGENTEFTISAEHQNLQIKAADGETISTVQVTNMNGQAVSTDSTNGTTAELTVPQPGIYIVRVEYTNGNFNVRKVMINE